MEFGNHPSSGVWISIGGAGHCQKPVIQFTDDADALSEFAIGLSAFVEAVDGGQQHR